MIKDIEKEITCRYCGNSLNIVTKEKVITEINEYNLGIDLSVFPDMCMNCWETFKPVIVELTKEYRKNE